MFFFLQWGKKRKQETIFGIKLNLNLPEQEGNIFNIAYTLEKGMIFWIGVGGWNIEDIKVQSVKSGKVYSLDDSLWKQAEDLYWKLKENAKKSTWICDKCGKEFILDNDKEKELKEIGKINAKCPHCKTIQLCARSN